MSQYQIDVQVDDEFLEYFNGAQGLTQNTLSAAALATLNNHAIAEGALTTATLITTMTIVVTTDAEVQVLNHSFLGIDAPTDVLSFPSQDNASAAAPLDLPPELAAEQAAYLGDLVIAFPYSGKQAFQHQRTHAEELSLLVVHGTLHLLGYDHLTLEEEREMWTVQAEVLASLGMVVPVESRDSAS